jgi:hypothetical protein
MLTITTEPFSHLAKEAAQLTAAHWDEVEARLHGAQHYALDDNRYASLERLGMLHISAARGPAVAAGGEPCDATDASTLDESHATSETGASAPLAGYAAFTIVDCHHRPQTLLAALDGLYLAPWARGGLFALRLLRHAEAALAARGVGLVQYSSPTSRPCHALYRRLGAQPTETIWHKTLSPQPSSAATAAKAKTVGAKAIWPPITKAKSTEEDKQWP